MEICAFYAGGHYQKRDGKRLAGRELDRDGERSHEYTLSFDPRMQITWRIPVDQDPGVTPGSRVPASAKLGAESR